MAVIAQRNTKKKKTVYTSMLNGWHGESRCGGGSTNLKACIVLQFNVLFRRFRRLAKGKVILILGID